MIYGQVAHAFDVIFAIKHGLNDAIVYQILLYDREMSRFECESAQKWKETQVGAMCEGGLIWTRYSGEALIKRFPYLEKSSVCSALASLENKNLIHVKPSKTEGYTWIAVVRDDYGQQTN